MVDPNFHFSFQSIAQANTCFFTVINCEKILTSLCGGTIILMLVLSNLYPEQFGSFFVKLIEDRIQMMQGARKMPLLAIKHFRQ